MLLPLYSFWHFDDFSWGATRVVRGEKTDQGHGDGSGKFDSKRITLKTWQAWEADRKGYRKKKGSSVNVNACTLNVKNINNEQRD